MQKELWRKGLVIGIIVLFVGASVTPSITGHDKDVEKIEYLLNENETLNMKNDDYDNLMKQVIERGIISNNDWSEQDKLLPSDGASGDYFSDSVSIDGDYAIIGSLYDDVNGGNSGSAYVFTRSGSTWIQQAKLLASDGAADDRFGGSVSIDGDYAIIGAYMDDDNGDSSGSAYVFTRSDTAWTQQAKLLPSDGAAYDSFGCRVSISGDYAIIGAPDDDNGDSSGSAYVFKNNIPDLDCDGTLNWQEVEPGSTVTGSFTVENIGDPNSELDWEIVSYPDWGTWTFTPDSGEGLTPEDGVITINVEVVAPDEADGELTGEVKIVNSEDTDDFCTIDATMTKPVSQISSSPMFQRPFERHPNVYLILQKILGL